MALFKRRVFLLSILLIITELLSACDIAAFCYLTIYRVNTFNNAVYITAREEISYGLGSCKTYGDHFFTSNNDGKTWNELSHLPFEIAPAKGKPEPISAIVCVPSEINICYRISGKEQVDISHNGGKSWQVDWQVPAYREEFVHRNPYITRLSNVEPDTVPYSIGIIQNERNHVVYVAMGNQGILVKTPIGKWERYVVYSIGILVASRPLPFYASSVKEVEQAISSEISWVLFSAAIYFIALSLYNWHLIQISRDQSSQHGKNLYRLPFVLALVIMVVYGVFMFFGTFLLLDRIYSFYEKVFQIISDIFIFTDPFTLTCWIPIFGLLISWLLLVKTSRNKKADAYKALTTLAYPLGLIILTLLPFVLWTIGTIPMYKVSLVLSILLGTIITTLGIVNTMRISVTQKS